MSRIDEALRRVTGGETAPESINVATARALERFPSVPEDPVAPGQDRHAVEATPEPDFADRLRPAATRETPEGPDTDGLRRANGSAPVFQFGLAEKLVVDTRTDPAAVEQYRRIAATLHETQSSRGIKVVMVTSAIAGEGKTLTTINLAMTLSESYGRRVLLIDADLRRPMLQEVLRLPSCRGLNEGLKADRDEELAVIEVTPNLSLLPGGAPNHDPMGALSSDRMRRVIEDATTRFDWVILDTPPVAILTDARLLTTMVHGVVLVIAAGRTPFTLTEEAVTALGRDRILGTVLNGVDVNAMPAAFYGYYSYYPKTAS